MQNTGMASVMEEEEFFWKRTKTKQNSFLGLTMVCPEFSSLITKKTKVSLLECQSKHTSQRGPVLLLILEIFNTGIEHFSSSSKKDKVEVEPQYKMETEE